MKELILRLLNSYVIPNNSKIDSFRMFILGAGGNKMYIVQVSSYYDLTKEERNNIYEDISKVFNSFGLPEGSEFMVTYNKLD